MGVLREIGRFVGNIFELIACAIVGLIAAAIWAIAFVIDLVTDVLGWINDRIEELLDEGATEVNTIKGSALSDFIKQNQAQGRYTEISLNDLNAMRNSVVNVAMNNNGEIIDDQMIRSNGGLSSQANEQFRGEPILKIRIPA
ncbi:MAG: hypothetical protein J1F40_09150 [Prevotellaceae bacterium]|nr:hypothetical protein [Prevotellaceae bacterium]